MTTSSPTRISSTESGQLIAMRPLHDRLRPPDRFLGPSSGPPRLAPFSASDASQSVRVLFECCLSTSQQR